MRETMKKKEEVRRNCNVALEFVLSRVVKIIMTDKLLYEKMHQSDLEMTLSSIFLIAI